MIQIITSNTKKYEQFTKKNFAISTIDEFQSFDDFDITVIDISDEALWQNHDNNTSTINQYHDLLSIKESIQKSQKSRILLLFPQNIEYKYYYHFITNTTKGYEHRIKLKDLRKQFVEIINSFLINMFSIEIDYGKNNTKINDSVLSADFSFINISEENIILKSNNGNDIVAIKNLNVILTTLKVEQEDELRDLLECCFPEILKKNNEEPKWLKDINFFTDYNCKKSIEKIDKNISVLKNKREQYEKELKTNQKYKMILYETGNVLSNQINNMLSKIFNYDISGFVDTYEEDCLIKLDKITFVIETKGLEKEIVGKNLSDANSHLIIYDDKLESKNISENTKCLFFVAYERNKNPKERTLIKKRIEVLAKGYKALIIDTRVFLDIFEDFLNKKIGKDEIEELFKNNIGVLNYQKKE